MFFFLPRQTFTFVNNMVPIWPFCYNYVCFCEALIGFSPKENRATGPHKTHPRRLIFPRGFSWPWRGVLSSASVPATIFHHYWPAMGASTVCGARGGVVSPPRAWPVVSGGLGWWLSPSAFFSCGIGHYPGLGLGPFSSMRTLRDTHIGQSASRRADGCPPPT